MTDTSQNAWWIPKRRSREEIMDGVDNSFAEFESSFRDLERLNRLFGGTSLVLKGARQLVGDKPQTIKVLDVCAGGADIPRALLKQAKNAGNSMSIVALDVNLKAVQIGMKSSRGVQDLNFIQGDALKLPYSDNSFDICICSLALHHFGDDSSVAVLREMHRVSAKWVLVSDLRRSWLCAALVWLVTRVLLMGRMARHDGPLSVLKARTIPEYKLLLQTAGLAGTVQSRPFWRAAIVVGKSP